MANNQKLAELLAEKVRDNNLVFNYGEVIKAMTQKGENIEMPPICWTKKSFIGETIFP